ncbi:uncharacterized protein LAJ45_03935 [Morchella importuna]|uniref:uncharacterized protein n=1 Tax=Morchella importuna TaxID=1174673 RepID=UPI001E8DE212|nr:uncharacterized protein LAJ45_03935 [Morchella importuna]KAH8151942.1 hypothetical protein LAJ45_03935 [Morchella importuna]
MLTYLAALLTEPAHFLLSLTPLSRLLPSIDHFAPHPTAPFEGYYTRIVTPSHGSILLILSSVRQAEDKPHYIHFSHIPSVSGPQDKALQIDVFSTITDVLGERKESGFQEFTRVVSDGIGYCRTAEGEQKYSLRLPDPESESGDESVVEVEVTITQRAPWIEGDVLSTPEGAFSNLVHLLPLHWNVFSHKSMAEYTVKRGGELWLQGTGIAHSEKNWGVSFPAGWTWIQGFSDHKDHAGTSTFSLAGGKILGQKAFLLGYRSPKYSISFAPPTTLFPFSIPTPFCYEQHNSKAGTLSLRADNLMRTRRIVISVAGPANHERWVALNCPLSTGHGNKFAYETFEATLFVVISERRWPWQEWVQVETAQFTNAALEFGGDYSFKLKDT